MNTPILDRCHSLCDVLGTPLVEGAPAEVTVVGRSGSIVETNRDEIRDESLRWGAWFAERIEPGDRVALCIPTSVDFLHAFFGVLYAGGIAVPLASMVPHSDEYVAPFLEARAPVINNSGAKMLVTLADLVDTLSGLKDWCEGLETICSADDVDATADGFEPVARTLDDVAMLQYTSGSTGDPKGVELTDRCLLWNLDAINGGLGGVQPGDVCVSWLPLYHDMGLIGGCLYPLASGIGTNLMATEVFLTEPGFWLQAMAMKKASITVAPNFGYALCVKRVKEETIQSLDLSAVRVMLCGAEPIDPEVLAAFQDKFAPAGLPKDVILPVYGLAEATLAATFTNVGTPVKVARLDRAKLERDRVAVNSTDADAVPVVSVGTPLLSNELRIVDEDGRELGEDRQGEVLLASPSLMRGYWRNAEATANTIEDGWLHTGDLGFVRAGELYITGRKKDLIITYGRNFYPHDIERIAQRVDGVRTGCVAAFAVHNEEESTDEIAIVAETRSTDRSELIMMRRELRKLLINAIECNPKHVYLVGPGAVPKTTSGKLRRREAHRMFIAAAFDRLL